MRQGRCLHVLASAAVLLAVPVVAVAEADHDIEYHALYPGQESADGLDCRGGETAYDPFRAGQVLHLKDNAGMSLGSGVLTEVEPPSREGMCETSVAFVGVPDAPVYFVLASDQVVATRKREELEASGWVAKSMFGTAADLSTPQPTGVSGTEGVAQLYLALMNKWNARIEAEQEETDRRWDAAADDPQALGRLYLEDADFEQQRLDDVLAIQYPPEVQGQADELAATTEAHIVALRLVAGDPFDDVRLDRLDEASLAAHEAAVEMRRVLGLPAFVAAAQPTAEPVPDTIERYDVGSWVTVYDDGEPELRLRVERVREDPYFQLSYGREWPEDGLIYLSVFLRYEALANGADYNPYDWQIFVGDEAYGGQSFVIGGPRPELESGNLPKGRKAKGWVTFEVPRRGKVLLTYKSGFSFSDQAPPFEIVVRER